MILSPRSGFWGGCVGDNAAWKAEQHYQHRGITIAPRRAARWSANDDAQLRNDVWTQANGQERPLNGAELQRKPQRAAGPATRWGWHNRDLRQVPASRAICSKRDQAQQLKPRTHRDPSGLDPLAAGRDRHWLQIDGLYRHSCWAWHVLVVNLTSSLDIGERVRVTFGG